MIGGEDYAITLIIIGEMYMFVGVYDIFLFFAWGTRWDIVMPLLLLFLLPLLCKQTCLLVKGVNIFVLMSIVRKFL